MSLVSTVARNKKTKRLRLALDRCQLHHHLGLRLQAVNRLQRCHQFLCRLKYQRKSQMNLRISSQIVSNNNSALMTYILPLHSENIRKTVINIPRVPFNLFTIKTYSDYYRLSVLFVLQPGFRFIEIIFCFGARSVYCEFSLYILF